MDPAQSCFDAKMSNWKKSSFSDGNDNCAEVAANGGSVAVRNSKRRSQAPILFTPDEWIAFIRGVKAGEFDL